MPYHPDRRQTVSPFRKPSRSACLPFLSALDGKGNPAPTVQGGGDVEQLELSWLPEPPQDCEEAAGRRRGQHLLHVMAAHQELSLVWQQGAWKGQADTSGCAQPGTDPSPASPHPSSSLISSDVLLPP